MLGEKINIGNNVFVYTMPVTLVGTQVEGRVNFMTVGWISRVNANPPYIGVSINKNHYTAKGILENGSFSVNFPSSDMVKKTDYCGIVSGRKEDKSKLFDVFYGKIETAPMIKECPLNLECRLVDTIEFPTNYFFVGEILAAYSEEQYLTLGKPDIEKMELLLLTMPDNCYWTIGDYKGEAWKTGLSLMDKKGAEEDKA
ncbi:flavin reductase [Methanosarcina sp. Ant1]|nr:flavin reductase [Methanosarcina sp. Ant1]